MVVDILGNVHDDVFDNRGRDASFSEIEATYTAGRGCLRSVLCIVKMFALFLEDGSYYANRLCSKIRFDKAIYAGLAGGLVLCSSSVKS